MMIASRSSSGAGTSATGTGLRAWLPVVLSAVLLTQASFLLAGAVSRRTSVETTGRLCETIALPYRGSSASSAVPALPVLGTVEAPAPTEDVGQAVRIEAYNWGFQVSQTVIRKGEKVRVVVHSREGAHGVIFPQWRAATPPVRQGRTVVIEVLPDEAGRIGFACNVDCGIGHLAMRAAVEVSE